MITKDSIETAYSFLHQKRRSTSGRLLPTGRKNVYIHSSLDWQKDDIDDAISGGRADFLRDHKRFPEDITQAVERLENML